MESIIKRISEKSIKKENKIKIEASIHITLEKLTIS